MCGAMRGAVTVHLTIEYDTCEIVGDSVRDVAPVR